MTSQGSAHGRFTRALDYLVLLVELQPGRAPSAAIRWHGRLEIESVALTLTESQLALAALADLCAGSRDAAEILKRLLRRARPTLLPRTG